MDFEFKNFSTRSFERFTQALALHVLGNGGLIYGDGPDGAREATFEGKLNYPSDSDNWNGYTVMQAKFLQVPGAPHEDADWLVAQLRAELDKITAANSKNRMPEYYILVSNARLSPMPASSRSSGGIAKIDAVFAEYQSKLKLKDYRVWHHDQISSFLMSATELRRSYSAWLTTSDVISTLIEHTEERTREVQSGLYRYLTRELRSNQPLRLQQAGHSDHISTMIEDVFTDLPYAAKTNDQLLDEPPTLLLESLLQRSRDCLDAFSVQAQQNVTNGRPERILLLGGPGQGKSTLSQYLAQIFRANILHHNNAGHNTPEIQRIINSTLSKAEFYGLGIKLPKRFPLRIDLPSFADWLVRDLQRVANSLLDYIVEQVSSLGGVRLGTDDLRKSLSEDPSIVILDGLDEVPHSANRTEVLQAINEFWDEVTHADLLMIVTTRPQGYNDDLDPELYTKLEMTPLSPDQAVAYAKKLATARISDPGQCERVISRLIDASESPTTSRLMISPLQVAILLSLIDLRGEAPTDRWSLFDKYFSVVLQREQSKLGSIGETMRHWSRQISSIHSKAGFLLHAEAETQGKSESYLSREELLELVKAQLLEDEFEGDHLQTAIRALMDASTERLILLVQSVENKYSFEVRSLQEFMAASHIMSGREKVVRERLNTIAGRTHWLHVFQIAASKCFSEHDSEHYRDTIIQVCHNLNESNEEIDCLLKSGSILSIALLDDGLAYDQPKYRRLLLKIALEILMTGPRYLPRLLARHCSVDPQKAPALIRRYFIPMAETRQAAWKLIFQCHSEGYKWAEAVIETDWLAEKEDAVKILLSISPTDQKTWQQQIQALIESVPLHTLKRAILDEGPSKVNKISNYTRTYPYIGLLFASHSDRGLLELDIQYSLRKIQFYKYKSLILDQSTIDLYSNIPETDAWAAQRRVRDFHSNPSAKTLADILEMLGSDPEHKKSIFATLSNLPWPLATLVFMTHTTDYCFRDIAKKVREGAYGDIDQWLAAEKRWEQHGICEADFEGFARGVFFDNQVAHVGLPWLIVHSLNLKSSQQDFDLLLEHAMKATGSPRAWLKNISEMHLRQCGPEIEINVDQACFFLEPNRELNAKRKIPVDILEKISPSVIEQISTLELIDLAGRQGRFRTSVNMALQRNVYDCFARSIYNHPGLIVLLILIAQFDPQDEAWHVLSNIKLSRIDIHASERVELAKIALTAHRTGFISDIDKDIITASIGSDAISTIVPFLTDSRYNPDAQDQLSNILASAYNQDLTPVPNDVGTQLRSFAHSRIANIHTREAWKLLELGDFLFQFVFERRLSNAS